MSLVRDFYIVKFEQKVKNLVKVIPKCFVSLPEEERLEFLQFKGSLVFFLLLLNVCLLLLPNFNEMVCL